MWNNGQGYYAKFKYVEVARYLEIDGNKMVARYMIDTKKKILRLIDVKDVTEWAAKTKNVGVYTSVFRYATDKFEPNMVQVGNLYFDLDNDDPNVALQDARKIVDHLLQFMPEEAIRIHFSGKKGFHIECECVTLGITPAKNLAEIYRFIANDFVDKLELQCIDFAVYDPRRIWRLTNSVHQVTGLYKIPLSKSELMDMSMEQIAFLASEPRDSKVPDQVFNLTANEWYRNYTYRLEESKIERKKSAESIIERFNSHGSGHIDEYEKEFDPIRLFKGCPAILDLWRKAETKRNLEHEERLFLCSLLTYTDEAIEYLHSILANCDDYNFEKSQSHIEDWVRRREMGIGGRPYTCERAKSAGIACSGCVDLEAKPRYEKIGNKLYPTSELTNPSPVRLAYSRKD